MQYGIVKWYNEGQGRGGIVTDEGLKEVRVTHSDITGEGFKVLFEGQRVRFDIVETARGATAANVEMCGEE
jgi:cold shock protein